MFQETEYPSLAFPPNKGFMTVEVQEIEQNNKERIFFIELSPIPMESSSIFSFFIFFDYLRCFL